MSDDYYKALGVSRGASADEIRKAYKKLARQYHPDANPGDDKAATKFKEIQEAYSVLSDPEQREQYDQFGASFKQAGRGGQQFNWGGAGDVDLNDILGGLFGGARGFGGGGPGAGGRGGFGGGFGGQARPRKGEDLRAEIGVPFTVAAEGGNHDLTLRRGDQTERLEIHVPAGVKQGSVIRLAGQGYPGQHGGPAGDLLVTINVHPHPYFRREGNHLVIDVPLTPTEAALGARIDVPTLSEGMVVLTVPPGTSSGARLRLRGKGVPDQRTRQRGDQFVQIKIVVPKPLSPEGEQAYRQLADAAPLDPRSELWS